MIEVVTKEAGTGTPFSIIKYTPGSPDQFERARELAGTMRTLGLIAYVNGRPTYPWDSAAEGELWLLTNGEGYTRPYVRSTGGWRSIARKGQLFPASYFMDGQQLWRAEFDPDVCPNRDLHNTFSVRCYRCGALSPDSGTDA